MMMIQHGLSRRNRTLALDPGLLPRSWPREHVYLGECVRAWLSKRRRRELAGQRRRLEIGRDQLEPFELIEKNLIVLRQSI
jgi:hypothetical protein